MLSNSLINAIVCNMSQGNSSIHSRKKFPKNPLILSRDSNCKLKKSPSSSSCISDIIARDSQNLKTDLSENSKILPDHNNSLIQIDKTTSNANFPTRKLWNNNTSKVSRNTLHIPTHSIIEEESELIGMLTKQLYLAESQMRQMQCVLTKAEEGLKIKDQEIGRLKRKVKDWEIKYKNHEFILKKEQQNQADNSAHLYQRCLTLEQKIFEMETFLADYGLVWIGDRNNAKTSNNSSNNCIDAYYDQLVTNIDQLNLAVGKDEVHVYHNEKGGGATFKSPSCMVLKFYKNGIIVQTGPLRSYDDPATSSFIRDILDGYFPSELQQDYPNGVPFMIEDHRTELYVGKSVDFPGQGYRLGKQPAVDNMLSTSSLRSNNTLQKLGQMGSLSKDNISNSVKIPFLSLSSNRSMKSKVPIELPIANLPSLRLQILASHNNMCSNSHIQSHINAELPRSSRREKRELATKNIEYDISIKQKSTKSREISKPSSNGRLKYQSSTDRTLSRISSRLERVCLRPRSRSASLYGEQVGMQPVSRSKAWSTAEINNVGNLRATNLAAEYPTAKYPRTSKSAICARKSMPPVMHQINEMTGKSGELRLKVRSLNGSTVYLVHMSADESVAKLYELLDRAMITSKRGRYKVVLSGYSSKRLEQVAATLRENGISRDSVLHLVND